MLLAEFGAVRIRTFSFNVAVTCLLSAVVKLPRFSATVISLVEQWLLLLLFTFHKCTMACLAKTVIAIT